MLSLMRKNAGSFLIKVALSAIVIVFVFWGVGNFQEKKKDQVAVVNGEVISVEAYNKAKDNYMNNLKQQYGSNLNEDMIKMLQIPNQIINSLVTRQLLMQEAEKMKIRVTDKELATSIQSMSVFQENGKFNNQRYTILLNQNEIKPEEFESSQRESLLISKLNTYVTSGIKVTDGEILEWYNWINATVDIDYAMFDPATINDIVPTDEEMNAFYSENKESYKTEPKVKVRYLVFKPEQFKDKVKIDDEDIQDYYDQNQSEFQKEKTVEARHILLKLDKDASPEVVEEKRKEAEKILKMAREGKDFATLAKEYSEGSTRETGGLLGEFKKGDMVKAFSDAAFSLKEGEISEPVRTQYGWHLIKVEKIHKASELPLKDVSDKIRKELTEQQEKGFAYDAVEDAFDKALSDEDLEKTAAGLGMELQTTDYFTAAGPESGISNPETFASTAFDLSDDDISNPLNIGDDYYLMQKVDELASEIPPLKDVESQVRADLIKKMQDEQAQKNAEDFLMTVKKDEGIEKASQEKGVEVHNTGFFKRSASIPGIGYEAEMIKAAFLLSKDNKIGDKVFKGSKGYYVIQLKDRKSPDADKLDQQKDTIKNQLMTQKQQMVFENWLSKIRSESEISIDESYLK